MQIRSTGCTRIFMATLVELVFLAFFEFEYRIDVDGRLLASLELRVGLLPVSRFLTACIKMKASVSSGSLECESRYYIWTSYNRNIVQYVLYAHSKESLRSCRSVAPNSFIRPFTSNKRFVETGYFYPSDSFFGR
jgi:hypothetical protein